MTFFPLTGDVRSKLVVTGVHLNFMCGVGKTNHNDELYIKPVIKGFFTNGIIPS